MLDTFCSQYQSNVQQYSHILVYFQYFTSTHKFLGAFLLVNQTMSDYMFNSIKKVCGDNVLRE